ncbi:unnamed protein product [Oppiella nova]|uniref:Nuclear receptor domain-containing protein n=1 Tax=Oppiella nova TaxID=334625 RepID=A0A7R9MHT5_9ACAR|nr:unnamed protein product [Oppiella nova]CAG2177649.1 unnamed protein product [Oppiella nova]
MSDQLKQRLCLVCGDVSCGYHFEVLTCESCKSFFRRNALKNACTITVKNRKKCKKCRLDKCLAVGMKSSLIYNEKRKEIRRHIVEENRQKRQMIAEKTREVAVDSNTSSSSDHRNNETIISFDSLDVNSFAEELVANEYTKSDDLCMCHKSKTITNLEDEWQQTTSALVNPITDTSNQFNELESNRLTELLNALQKMQIYSFNMTKTKDPTHLRDSHEAWVIIMSQNERAIQEVVNMSKCLQGFNNLCENDRIILIKYSSIEIDILRMIMCFDFEQQAFR